MFGMFSFRVVGKGEYSGFDYIDIFFVGVVWEME